jgi:hypothetical protein
MDEKLCAAINYIQSLEVWFIMAQDVLHTRMVSEDTMRNTPKGGVFMANNIF